MMEYKATRKGLELVCESKEDIQDGCKTSYLIGDYMWLWDNLDDMLVAIIRKSDHKVVYRSKYIKRAEEALGTTVEDYAKKMREVEG